jgi:polyisoprenoid-binding protein YceI
MQINKFIRLALATAMMTAAAFAADEYKIDGAHSHASFKVKHMMISTVEGRFGDVGGNIQFDEKDLTKSSVDATIKTASITTDNDFRDKHLKSGDFFEVEKYPVITFKSKRIEKRGSNYVAVGDLTIKDVTKEVELPFELNTLKTAKGTVIGATAELKINRQDFHVKWNNPLEGGGVAVSDEVKIEISIEAKKPAPPAPAK